MNNPVSPITKKSSTVETATFLSTDITALYRQQLGMEVSKFLPSDGSFSLYQCTDTGYRFYYPKGMDGDGDFYAALQQKLADGYYHEWKFEYQLAYDTLKAGDKVLDIGCGVGNFLSKASLKAGEACGLELNKAAAEAGRKKGLVIYDELIGEHAAKKEGYYDVVCMFQVLEHIYDIKSFLDDAIKTLKKGGKLVIGVPNNEPYFLGYDKYCTLNLPPHHMGLWNRKVFERLAPLFKLSIDKVTYDVKGNVKTHAYLHAKYLLNIKSIGGQHSAVEKAKMLAMGCVTLPIAISKKITNQLNGSHIAVVFTKN